MKIDIKKEIVKDDYEVSYDLKTVTLYECIISELSKERRSFKWLADQVEFSRQGLKISLINETISFKTLVKVTKALKIKFTLSIED